MLPCTALRTSPWDGPAGVPQPADRLALCRRALRPDVLGGFPVAEGDDLFISVWNLHRQVSSTHAAVPSWSLICSEAGAKVSSRPVTVMELMTFCHHSRGQRVSAPHVCLHVAESALVAAGCQGTGMSRTGSTPTGSLWTRQCPRRPQRTSITSPLEAGVASA